MIKIKHGVKILGVKPEAVLAVTICDGVMTKYGVECVLTSVTDSKHGRGSFHYLGFAFDLRSRDLTSNERNQVLLDLKDALGPEFDVVLESDHFHIEWNPK